MAVHIQWDHPLYTIEQYKPMKYYLDYYNTEDLNIQPIHVLNATSVIIQPLYMNLSYHFSVSNILVYNKHFIIFICIADSISSSCL